jgi:hypothetical protein
VQDVRLSFNGRRRFWQLFTALAMRIPTATGNVDYDRLLPRPRPSGDAPSKARSLWLAPARAIRALDLRASAPCNPPT